MPVVLKRLGLGRHSPKHLERDLRLGRIYAAEASWRRMRTLHAEGVVTGEIWDGLQAQRQSERKQLEQEIHDLYLEHGELERELTITIRREALRAERAALEEARQRSLIGEDAFETLTNDVNKRIEALRLIAAMEAHETEDENEPNP
jgi:hypothetical protein